MSAGVHNQLSNRRDCEAVTILKDVLKTKIRIDENQQRKSKEIITEFLKSLVEQLKQTDDIFKDVFQRIYYTGSFYEDLRIVSASEFDINLVLKLPVQQSKRKVEFLSDIKSFAMYKLCPEKNEAISSNIEKILSKFFKDGYLMPAHVKSWLQSCIAKVDSKGFKPVKNVKKISCRQSGPARTVRLETSYNYSIDIDLVPVIEFTSPEWPKNFSKEAINKFSVPADKQFWFLVPKEFNYYSSASSKNYEHFMWRIHFPEIEKHILHNKGCVKPIIKLLKLLRDKEDWQAISSYYLKTVLLWEVKSNPSSDYWNERHMYARFLDVLKSLHNYVMKRNLPYFFSQDFNLFHKLDFDHGSNIQHRLNRIISSVEKDYHMLQEIF